MPSFGFSRSKLAQAFEIMVFLTTSVPLHLEMYLVLT